MREVKELLDNSLSKIKRDDFILPDPISIPHQFQRKEDIEISGFLSATIAWGQRKSILVNANRLIQLMDPSPFDYITNLELSSRERNRFLNFCHRTFNDSDAWYFMKALHYIYKEHGGLEQAFSRVPHDMQLSIENFRTLFLKFKPGKHVSKHVSSPVNGSAAKRLNMYLRWMVRRDKKKIDFGLWDSIEPSALICPLDVHSERIARELGILKRKQNDWKAALELTEALRKFDSKDPVKYDLALFSIGVNGH